MGNLFYPQLSSGALAQYPINKTRLFRTITNISPDGNLLLTPDPGSSRLIWSLAYSGLSLVDLQALSAHFAACNGPFHTFTFIDPTDNMLQWSSDLTNTAWHTDSPIRVQGGYADPLGGTSGFLITNLGDAAQQITQTLSVVANFNYSFSVYVTAAQGSSITLIRRGTSASQLSALPIGPAWGRLVSAGQLNDSGTTLTVGISLAAGQQIFLFGPQLEAQPGPSNYRPTTKLSAVYPNSHWAVDELSMTGTAPGLYSTAFAIESAV